MCDSVGYVSEQANGREVKCWNPECPVPVYKVSPKPGPRASAEGNSPKEPRNTGIPLSLVISISVFVGLISLGVSWFIYVRKPVSSAPPVAETRGSLRNDAAAPPSAPKEEPVPESNREPVVVERTSQQALDAILASSNREELNRSKPYCVRLAAYGFALEGNETGALEQLERLRKFRSYPPHYQIEPLAQLAWNSIRAGEIEQAGTWLTKAGENIDYLGNRGRSRLDLGVPLAAAYAAVGDYKNSEKLLSEPDASSTGQLAAATLIARTIGTFSIRQWMPGTFPGGWENPQRTAVCVQLAAAGKLDSAVKCVSLGKTVGEKFEALLAVIETRARISTTESKAALLQPFQSLLAEFSPDALAGLHARIGLELLARGDEAGSRESLRTATELFSQFPELKPIKFANYKEFLELPLPGPGKARLRAFAGIESARLAGKLGESETAVKFFASFQEVLRGTSLSQSQVSTLEDRIETLGSAGFQKELKKQFHLKTDDEARRSANEVTRRIALWKPVADRRFEIQCAILSSFQDPQLKARIAEEISSRSSSTDSNEREDYDSSSLPIRMTGEQGETGPGSLGYYLSFDLRSIGAREVWNSRREWATLVGQNKQDEAATVMRRVENADDAEYWLAWEGNRLVEEKQAAEALRIVGRLTNINHREDLLRLICSQCVVTGQAEVAWKSSESSLVVPTVKVASYTGILEGLVHRGETRTGTASEGR